MSLSIINPKLTESGSVKPPNYIKDSNSQVLKNKLAGVLFAKNLQTSRQISFGWSQGISAVESQILDVLTDPKNKEILIISHNQPDGDAYGSSTGVAGILKSLGANVYPVIDDEPYFNFRQMPSAEYDKSVLKSSMTAVDFSKKNINNVDVAVITDSAIPDRISKASFDLLSKAKKIVIIDHHVSEKGKDFFREKWEKELKAIGIQPEKLLYWAEERVSASEMVAEIDKEVLDEALKGNLINYNPAKNNTDLKYRLAAAGGIITDTSLEVPKDLDDPDFNIQSAKKVKMPDGNLVSSTVASFKWLVQNSGVNPSKINFEKIIKQNIPEDLDTFLEQLLYFQIPYNGIEVKNPSHFNQWGYTYIRNNEALKKIAQKYSTETEPFVASDIFRIIKNKEKEKLFYGMPGCIIVLATDRPDKTFELSIRSTDHSAIEVLKVLEKAGFGEGGGHKYACGFISKPGVDFMADAVPVINRFIKIKAQKEKNKAKQLVNGSDLNVVG